MPRWCGSCTAAPANSGWQYNCHPNTPAGQARPLRLAKQPMPLTAITGSPGSGKTDRLLATYRTRLAENRPGTALWLAPTWRAAAEVRGRLLGGVLDGCFSPAVMTFDQFAETILRLVPEPVRPLGRSMKRHLVRQLIEQHRAAGDLVHFAPIAATGGLVDLVCDLIGELKRLEIWPEQFAAACDAAGYVAERSGAARPLPGLSTAIAGASPVRCRRLDCGWSKHRGRCRLQGNRPWSAPPRDRSPLGQIWRAGGGRRIYRFHPHPARNTGNSRPGRGRCPGLAAAGAPLRRFLDSPGPTCSASRWRPWPNSGGGTAGMKIEELPRPESPAWSAMAHLEQTLFGNPRRRESGGGQSAFSRCENRDSPTRRGWKFWRPPARWAKSK